MPDERQEQFGLLMDIMDMPSRYEKLVKQHPHFKDMPH